MRTTFSRVDSELLRIWFCFLVLPEEEEEEEEVDKAIISYANGTASGLFMRQVGWMGNRTRVRTKEWPSEPCSVRTCINNSRFCR